MIACHCLVVSEGDIADLVDQGVSDVDDLAAACGAGSGCGGCIPLLRGMVEPTHRSLPRDPRSPHPGTTVSVRGTVAV